MTADAERLVAIRARRALVPDVLSWMDVGPSRIDGFARPDQRAADVRRRAQVDEFIAHAPEDIGYLLTVAAEYDAEKERAEKAEAKLLNFKSRYDARADLVDRVVDENNALRARIEAVKVWRSWYATGEAPSPSEWRDLDRRLAGDQPEAAQS